MNSGRLKINELKKSYKQLSVKVLQNSILIQLISYNSRPSNLIKIPNPLNSRSFQTKYC